MYERARKAGALGGKILGAGAGGFLMLTAPVEKHEAIIHALPELRNIPVKFDKVGSRISFLVIPRPLISNAVYRNYPFTVTNVCRLLGRSP